MNFKTTCRLKVARSLYLLFVYFLPSFNNFPKQDLIFKCLIFKSFENTMEKGEIACNEQLVLFSQCFLPFWITFCYSNQIKNCCQQTPSASLEESRISFWERVKLNFHQQIIYTSTDHIKGQIVLFTLSPMHTFKWYDTTFKF